MNISESIDPTALTLRQFRLECIGVDAEGMFMPIPCSNPDDIPRVYLARHSTGYLRYFRRDLPSDLRERLAAIPPGDAMVDHERVVTILRETGEIEEIFSGKSYIFPGTLSAADYPDAIRLEPRHRTLIEAYDPQLDPGGPAVWAVIADGQITATCQSSRENHDAAEAWVRTQPAFRRRGFARQVTAAWAHALQRQGKTPFYSHRRDNLASQAVARSLGLLLYIENVAFR